MIKHVDVESLMKENSTKLDETMSKLKKTESTRESVCFVMISCFQDIPIDKLKDGDYEGCKKDVNISMSLEEMESVEKYCAEQNCSIKDLFAGAIENLNSRNVSVTHEPLPKELDNDEAKRDLDVLRSEGYLDLQYKPTPKFTRPLKALAIGALGEKYCPQRRWVVLEKYWNINNCAREYLNANNASSKKYNNFLNFLLKHNIKILN